MEIPRTQDGTVIIGLTGDVMIGRLVDDMLSYKDPSYLWGDMLPLLNQTDMNLINLEAALTLSEKEVFKIYHFKAKPERIETLTLASVDVANLANNHCLDYSYEGLVDTLKGLDKAGIRHIGAGENISEAKRPAILHIKGIKIGILGCTDNEPSWKATQESPGVFFTEIGKTEGEKIAQEVRDLLDQVDLVILSIHWGPNMRERPPKYFRHFAHQMIDAGVDIFHGHSAHIFQGVEMYHQKVIFYDTGDFVDDYAVDPFLRNDHTFFFTVEADKKDLVGIRLIPALIGNCQVNLPKGVEKKEIMRRMILLSKEMETELIIEEEALVLKC